MYFRSASPALLLAITLLLATTLLSSCAPIHQKLVGEPVSQDFADGLMQGWLESSSRVISIQGLAKVKVYTPENSLNGSQVILAEKPDRLRAETLSPFGSPLLLLAADGEKLGVLLPSRNIYYTGAATAENLGRFVRIPLGLPDLVTILLYQPPMIDVLNEEAFALEKGGWFLVRHTMEGRQELTFNSGHHLVEVNYFDQNKLLLKIDYGKFSEEADPFPHYFRIELPEQMTTASLEFSDLETNGELPSGIFQLTPPSGVTVVSLDE